MVDLNQQRNRICACLETIKTNHLECPLGDMKFLQAGRLNSNHDVFSCAMVLLIIFLSKTRITFIYVNISSTVIEGARALFSFLSAH